MTIDRIPLVGSMNPRKLDGRVNYFTDGKDQRFISCFFEIVKNPVTGKVTAYLDKRSGFLGYATYSSGKKGATISGDGLVTIFEGSSGYDIFYQGVLVGNSSDNLANLGTPAYITKFLHQDPLGPTGGTAIYLITGSGGYLFFFSTASYTNTTFTADTTNGSAILTNVSSMTNKYSGHWLTGSGIDTFTNILTVDSATQITMTKVATATAVGVTITRHGLGYIVDPDFPISAGGAQGPAVEMDGYIFFVSGERLYNSALNNFTSYSSDGYLTLSMSADTLGAGAIRVKNRLMAFGTNSIEVFKNVGNPTGSPLQRMDDSFMAIGASGVYTQLAQMGDYVAWVGGEGERSAVYLMDGDNGLKRVSTPAVEKVIGLEGSVAANIAMFDCRYGPFIYLYMYTSSPHYSLLYDIRNNVWSESGFPDGTIVSNDFKAVNAVNTTGKYYWNIGLDALGVAYTDDGTAYTMTVQTSRIDHGTDKRKFVRSVRLIGDKQASGTATLECSDDDYGSFVTLGTFDMTLMEKKIVRCGAHKGGRVYRLTHSANTRFRVEALEVEYEVER